MLREKILPNEIKRITAARNGRRLVITVNQSMAVMGYLEYYRVNALGRPIALRLFRPGV